MCCSWRKPVSSISPSDLKEFLRPQQSEGSSCPPLLGQASPSCLSWGRRGHGIAEVKFCVDPGGSVSKARALPALSRRDGGVAGSSLRWREG